MLFYFINMEFRELNLNDLKEIISNGPKYNSWSLVTDEYFSTDENIEKICYDGYGYCILDGNNRVDVWNPDYPNSDIYKLERERFNSNITINKDYEYYDEIIELLSSNLSSCNHTFKNLKLVIYQIENEKNIVINIGKTIDYFRSKGGFCDCEILLNCL